ncbi:probable leucine--tRNA ligase, mitochondrial [Mytilus trossulus]|uniref:probable leucine--tRNA ligase, mitochondrial n=1 Tax=Mytilus trossulus TaxID=6551 RepID=UPI003005C685
MRCKLPVSWCQWRFMKTNPGILNLDFSSYRIVTARNLYSKTKIWPAKYDSETRIEMEKYWNPKIQEQNKTRHKFDLKSDKEKYYVLSMFPYPSGKLHMGHVRVYTLSDCMARYHRLKGKQVIHPMGWDAFGLPAENAAIERGEMPDKWTKSNIESMRKQLEELHCSFDWDRELSTCDPSYYKWSQFIFLKMYEAGLVYQREGLVNWDPIDQTVLANEQIDDQGHSWRSGAKVEKKYLRQWYIKTTAYSKSLSDGLKELNPEYWRDIISLQRNWIGKCTGTRLDFLLKNGDETMTDPLSVFTYHPEALCGVTHITLSPEHRFNDPQFYKLKDTDQSQSMSADRLLSIEAVHPITGDRIPIIISNAQDETMESYLGIPSLSQQDRQCAEKFGFTFKEVIDSDGNVINSEQFSGLTKNQAFQEVCSYAKEKGFGGQLTSAKLKDWLISRQRYWGTPIPMIHCQKCQIVPVPQEELPVKLPKLESLTQKGLSPLTQATEWLNVKCPKCGGNATRETDTMDTFVDSSWYFLRYLDPSNSSLPFEREVANQLMPVDLYIGGKEHATLHMFFARFFNHFLCDAGFLSHREPFTNLLPQGMVLGQSYKVKETGQYLKPKEIDFSNHKSPVEKSTGKPLIQEWEKMSKSKYNGVDPQEIIDEYGVSATRMTIVYNVAPKSDRKWSNTEFKGVLNWKGKVWSLVTMVLKNYNKVDTAFQDINEWNRKIKEVRNIHLAEINYNFETTFMISVAITAMQQLTEYLRSVPTEVAVNSDMFLQTLAEVIIMISPISPSFASELWEGYRNKITSCSTCDMNQSVQEQTWPEVDKDCNMVLNVKCNNKMVFNTTVPYTVLNTLSKEEAQQISNRHPVYKRYFEEHTVKGVHLTVKPDYKAIIDYHIPDIDEDVIRKLNKKRKKK